MENIIPLAFKEKDTYCGKLPSSILCINKNNPRGKSCLIHRQQLWCPSGQVSYKTLLYHLVGQRQSRICCCQHQAPYLTPLLPSSKRPWVSSSVTCHSTCSLSASWGSPGQENVDFSFQPNYWGKIAGEPCGSWVIFHWVEILSYPKTWKKTGWRGWSTHVHFEKIDSISELSESVAGLKLPGPLLPNTLYPNGIQARR